MEQIITAKIQPSDSREPQSIKEQDLVKAAHLSSNPINGQSNNGTAHFEVEIEKAFFRVFFGC